MNAFEITVVILLFLIWAQHSEGVKTLAKKLTRTRRKLVRRVKGN